MNQFTIIPEILVKAIMQENELKTSALETNYIIVMVYSLMDIQNPLIYIL